MTFKLVFKNCWKEEEMFEWFGVALYRVRRMIHLSVGFLGFIFVLTAEI